MNSIDPNTIIEVFKICLEGFKQADKWFKDNNKKFDFSGLAARNYTAQIKDRYGFIKIFGMNEPIPIRKIYVRVNILEKITTRQRVTIEELEKSFDSDRYGFGVPRASKMGYEVVNELQKFILLGKPGSGKTTFLKYMALQAADGKFAQKRVPVFIGLKDLAESNKLLKDFIVEQFDICHFPEANLFIERLLKKGKCILFLDGLDEVNRDKVNEVIKQVINFSDKYSGNQFILSCRIAAYNYCFEKFTDVEMADFTDEQIKNFIDNWFGNGTAKAKLCWEKVKSSRQYTELASIPLMLTMLCLAFDETMDFPQNRAELYKDAIDALLRKWDASRNIKRDEIYRYLSVKRKESMFSRIAASTFEKGQYFFPQLALEKHITDFIQHLPEASEETLEIDSEVILKAIESQHGIFVERAKGIYSFCHLTIQEYFTAEYIVLHATKGTLKQLVEKHLHDHNWREIFLLTAGMLEEADEFLLLVKKKIDSMLIGKTNRNLYKFINMLQSNLLKNGINLSPGNIALFLQRAFIQIFRLIEKETQMNPDDDIHDDEFYLRLTYDANIIISSAESIADSLGYITTPDYNFYFDHNFIISLTSDDFDLISNYCRANEVLVDCINAECYVSKQTRQKIYNDLFAIPD